MKGGKNRLTQVYYLASHAHLVAKSKCYFLRPFRGFPIYLQFLKKGEGIYQKRTGYSQNNLGEGQISIS